VDIDAKNNHLTGIGILHSDLNLVIVEGGPKGVRRYKKLMLERLKWSEKIPDNQCDLIWEGVIPKAKFGLFKLKTCTTDQNVKEELGVECQHYWDLAKNFTRAQ
jgi:U4/U6 small nuclear ribonucleoprotein PRP3